MKKHTFKQGDRVFGQSYTGDVKIPGVFVKKGGTKGDGYIIHRDDGVSGIEPGLYWFADYLTTHDTNFQVGDWVRYEAMEPYKKGYYTENGKVGQITYLGQEFATIKGELKEERFISNLVKIQPPQEAQMKPIRIKHEKYGVMEGVNVLQGGLDYGFTKDGAHYFVGNGWSQVPEVEWITIQVEKEDWDRVDSDGGIFKSRTKRGYHFEVNWRYPQ